MRVELGREYELVRRPLAHKGRDENADQHSQSNLDLLQMVAYPTFCAVTSLDCDLTVHATQQPMRSFLLSQQ